MQNFTKYFKKPKANIPEPEFSLLIKKSKSLENHRKRGMVSYCVSRKKVLPPFLFLLEKRSLASYTVDNPGRENILYTVWFRKIDRVRSQQYFFIMKPSDLFIDAIEDTDYRS